MEPPQRRDINELLVNGYFKTSRSRSPAGFTPTTSSPSYLTTPDRYTQRERSRSREPRRRLGPPPPRPIVEDEAVSLSRESSSSSSITEKDPPLRGVIEQHPIILEAEVSDAEAARLHAAPCPKEDDNPERRYVLVPKPETSTDDNVPKRREPREPLDSRRQDPVRNGDEKLTPRPLPVRKGSRQDLPSLVTKVPRDIPPQFRRSASAQGPILKDNDLTPRPPPGPRTPGPGEYMLLPDVPRGKDYFGSAAPRRREDSVGRNGTPIADKRRSGGSIARPTTPSEKRNSGNFDQPRSRRGTNEKMTRPQQLSEDEYRRGERSSARLSTGSDARSGRSSPHSFKRHESSESDPADSDSERSRRHRHRRHNELQVDDHRRRSSSRSHHGSIDLKTRNSNSPLPSPKGSPSQPPIRGLSPRGDKVRAETFPQRSGSRSPVDRPISPYFAMDDTPKPYDRLNPMDPPGRSRSRQRQSHSISTPTSALPSSKPPFSIPIVNPSTNKPEPLKMPGFSQYDEAGAQSARAKESKPFWQPPPFQPPSDHLEKPIGTYRRYSEDIERGSIVPLPSCPRTKFMRGRNDWLTLPGTQSFDICPSCFNSIIAPTEFRNAFVPAPRRPHDTEVICDFGSSPWYRIAWLLTRKERLRDLKLFHGLAHISARIPQCTGKQQDVRQWHSLIDPKTRTPLQDFNVCYSCVKSIELLLPPIRGIFVKLESRRPMGDPRVCDLRFDSKKFIQYFDALETTADQAAEEDTPPDTRSLVSLTKRLSSSPECPGSTDLLDQRWNLITQLPDFTVCEECYENVVYPELEDGKAIPSMFGEKLVRVPKASCQLYGSRMRGIFRTAVDGNDYKLLAQKARERKAAEVRWKALVGGTVAYGVEERKRIEEEWKRWD